jgi:hypothetical protein
MITLLKVPVTTPLKYFISAFWFLLLTYLAEFSWLLFLITEFRVTLRLAVYRSSVRLGDKPLETHGQNFYFPTEHLRSVVYNCCWASPAQSFSGPSPTGLMTIFYCLRFETSATWRVRSLYFYLPGTGWSSYTPQSLCSLFVASYDSQGYGGGIRSRLHKGFLIQYPHFHITLFLAFTAHSWL